MSNTIINNDFFDEYGSYHITDNICNFLIEVNEIFLHARYTRRQSKNPVTVILTNNHNYNIISSLNNKSEFFNFAYDRIIEHIKNDKFSNKIDDHNDLRKLVLKSKFFFCDIVGAINSGYLLSQIDHEKSLYKYNYFRFKKFLYDGYDFDHYELPEDFKSAIIADFMKQT